MTSRVPRPNVIDRIWLAAADGRWHSRSRLVQETRFEAKEITAALCFLVKYGFAESSIVQEERFRMVTDGPSPSETANILQVVNEKADSARIAERPWDGKAFLEKPSTITF